MPATPAQVSVIAPISPAIERTRRLLFQPFAFSRWFAIGFCAWLARLGEVGFSGLNSRFVTPRVPSLPSFPSFPSFPSSPSLPSGREDFGTWERHARSGLVENLYWVVPLALAIACAVAALWLLAIWLGSRGEFMFLHCVAHDRAEVAAPWRRYAGEARSLFHFRLALGLIAVGPILLLLGSIAVFVGWIYHEGGDMAPAVVLPLIAAGLAVLAIGLGFLVVAKLTQDLVVPIMFVRGATWRQAWNELLGLVAGRRHLLVIYLLFQIVLGLAIGAVIVAAVIATCCLGGCLLAIPYVGTVALLPVLVFQRSYSVYYLEHLGVAVFPAAAVPAPAGAG